MNVPNLQLDGLTVATVSDDVAVALKQMVELHGVGEQQMEGHPLHLVTTDGNRPRWIAAEMSIGLVFWADRPVSSAL